MNAASSLLPTMTPLRKLPLSSVTSLVKDMTCPGFATIALPLNTWLDAKCMMSKKEERMRMVKNAITLVQLMALTKTATIANEAATKAATDTAT